LSKYSETCHKAATHEEFDVVVVVAVVVVLVVASVSVMFKSSLVELVSDENAVGSVALVSLKVSVELESGETVVLGETLGPVDELGASEGDAVVLILGEKLGPVDKLGASVGRSEGLNVGEISGLAAIQLVSSQDFLQQSS
jgi:hypothetical protein